MKLLCIDPGTEESGVIIFDGYNILESYSSFNNNELVSKIRIGSFKCEHLAIEMIASYGMAVGKSTFETCLWIGRFIQAFAGYYDYTKIYRKDVKMELCGTNRAKDANVRQAIIDLFPSSGGGKTPQIGTKKDPGPLYGMSSHAWPALGVGITWFRSSEYDSV